MVTLLRHLLYIIACHAAMTYSTSTTTTLTTSISTTSSNSPPYPSTSQTPGAPGIPYTLGNLHKGPAVITINGAIPLNPTSILMNAILGITEIALGHDIHKNALAQKALISYRGYQDTLIVLRPNLEPNIFRFDYVFDTLFVICKDVKDSRDAWVNSIHRVVYDGQLAGTIAYQKGRLEGDGGSPPSGWEEVGRRDEGVDQRVNLGTRNERRSSQRMVNRGVVSIPELDSSPSSSRLSKRDIISVTLEELEGPEIGSISVLLTIMQAIIDAAKKPKADIVRRLQTSGSGCELKTRTLKQVNANAPESLTYRLAVRAFGVAALQIARAGTWGPVKFTIRLDGTPIGTGSIV